MASGCLVIGSRTAPVEEVIQEGGNELLVNFFDSEALTAAVVQALGFPQHFFEARACAGVEAHTHFNQKNGVENYQGLIDPVFGQDVICPDYVKRSVRSLAVTGHLGYKSPTRFLQNWLTAQQMEKQVA